jgi:hypothetical protein
MERSHMNVTQLFSPEQVVNRYVELRRPSETIVSTRRAIVDIRSTLPLCSLTDRELADLVAASAIEQGCVVAFDNE